MVYSSIAFIFYFMPLFFLLYYVAAKRFKNIIIFSGSVIFYSLGAPKFIFVILGTTFIDYYIVRLMCLSKGKSMKKVFLCLSLSINLGLLFYFKYSGFFIDNINSVLKYMGTTPVYWTKLVLPIGISFYTFETLTYVTDVYKDAGKRLRSVWDYQLYILLFPKLIAGQIYDHTSFETAENKLRGFYRFCIGLAKKVLVANVLGAAADDIFRLPVYAVSTFAAWHGALSYTLQIYFDFSGYSDMAIGLGLMMGFRFPENFNNPYTALSVTDFWRRWHMTLGAWMREYLYIPLGGNRVKSKRRLYLNLWVVFLVSGLWHGAAWGFVIWGAYHGFFIVVERLFLNKWLLRSGKFACLYTFLCVLTGWVFFRAQDPATATGFIKKMFFWSKDRGVWAPGKDFYTILGIAIFFSFFTLSRWGERVQQKVFYSNYSLKFHFVMLSVAISLCIISAGRISSSTFNPFIYFRF
jgi:alginate O-acetyltransferase complex protein AlgI